ncbi:MAG: formimidoylglutamase [Bacteroidota bacterium]
MKDLSIFFSPAEIPTEIKEQSLGNSIVVYTPGDFPVMKKGGVALIHVPEYRGIKNSNFSTQKEHFRAHLYDLHPNVGWDFQVYDLGTILQGNEKSDTWFAVQSVVEELVKNDIFPLIIGGAQDLTVPLYRGYKALEQMVNVCTIDNQLDLGNYEEEIHSEGYLSHLLFDRPCYLFNCANIGLQIPFASNAEFDLFDKLYFDVCRLGEFNADFKKAEPHLRNADILSIDLNSIKASELNSESYLSPNGFFAHQICQIAYYAGISDKLTSAGIFNYFPEAKPGILSSLTAQIVWYLMDGFAQRKGDFPVGSKKNYTRFTVHVESSNEDLVFFKSNRSDRWWLEVSYPGQKGSEYERHHMVPCDKDDYERAMQNEIPDLWWKTYQKLM